MELYLKGKTAVITGASQGMGRAIAKELAIEGVKVFVTARNKELLDSLRTEIAAAGGVEPITFVQDFVTAAGPQKIAAAAFASLGHIDILINNAGRSAPMDVVGTDEDWNSAMTLDFERPRQLTQQFIPHFITNKQGVILNLGSTYELRMVNGSSVAKAGLVIWSKQLAGQLGQYGIRVNCLQPGLIDTNNIRRFFSADERKEFAEREIPMGDFGEPEDIASMAVFLVSPRARYVTGSVIKVDGGLSHYPF